jgi:hypothetical protein
MAVSRHAVAIFEEGFMLVAVSLEAVQDYGERTIWRVIQNHDWVARQGIPIVIVYSTDDGDIRLYGDRDIVDLVSDLDFDSIVWGHELTLEWPD